MIILLTCTGSITGKVIAAVQVFFFEGPGRKLSRLQQLAAALFLSLSRCSRRPIIIKRIDQLAFSNAVKFTSKTEKIHVHDMHTRYLTLAAFCMQELLVCHDQRNRTN